MSNLSGRGRYPLMSAWGFSKFTLGSRRAASTKGIRLPHSSRYLFQDWWWGDNLGAISTLTHEINDSVGFTPSEIAEAVWTYNGPEGRTLT